MSQTYVIPDIHGRSDLLNEALAAIDLRSGGEAGAIVTIGDYVDKGPDSRGVIDRLLAGVDAGWKLVTLKGNHDALMVAALRDPAKMAAWMGKGGDAALADYELLELLLFRLIPRRDTKPIAKALIARFGTLGGVLGAPLPLLQEVKGVGETVALDLKLVASVSQRMLKSEIRNKQVLGSWSSVIDYCHAAMAHETREQFRVLS